MSVGTPTFASEVVEAYNEMAALESANDFFVAGFSATDKSKLALHATGRGGVRALTEILDRDFESELAVAMFRVTALDERGLTVSRRTKLIHVIFIGPRTPVMVRAKVSSWNAALRQPFNANLAVQTDNARDDLTERAIEKALRASGGAHQPTSYDFDNSTTAHDLLPRRVAHDAAASPSPPPVPAPSSSAPDRKTTFVPIEVAPAVPVLVPVTPSRRTPGGNEKFSSVMDRYQAAFVSVDVERLLSLYDENATLVHTNVASETTAQHHGTQGLRDFFDGKLQRLTPGLRVLSAVRLQPDPEQSSEGVAYLHWTADAVAFASETVLVSAGAIVAHTLVTDLEAESEKDDEIAPLRSEWPGGSTTASFGDQSVGDGTTTLDDPSTDGEHANNSDEEHDAAARASTMAQPSDTDSLAPTLVSEEDPTVLSQMTGSKKGSIEGEEELNFGGDEDSVLNLPGGAAASNLKSEEPEQQE